MANALQAVRQGVQKEASDELLGSERHDLGIAALTIVAPAEADVAVVEIDQPAIGDRDAMGVAAEIGQHLRGAPKGGLGIDHPVEAAQRDQALGEDGRLRQAGEFAEEAELVGFESSLQVLEEQPSE